MPAIGAAPKNPSDPENEAGLLAERERQGKAGQGCDERPLRLVAWPLPFASGAFIVTRMALENLDLAPVADRALGMEIPVIDMGGGRAGVTRKIAEACLAWGFFQIVGHSVPAELVSAASAEAQSLFAAGKAQKRMLTRSRDNPWGYYDRELTKNARDKKEIYDIGPDAGGVDPGDAPFTGATPWPAWQPSFETTMRAYFEACTTASADLVDMIADGLGAPPGALRGAFAEEHTSFLRLNYYPVDDPLAGETEERADLGIHHHTDAGALTLLLQDEVRGLQVYRDGLWHTVEPLRGALVVNISDMVQVWSNDRYCAPVHRVLAMDRAARRSLAFFYNPGYRAAVAPLPNLVTAKTPARYKPIVWSDFRRRRADGDFANYGAEVQIADYRI